MSYMSTWNSHRNNTIRFKPICVFLSHHKTLKRPEQDELPWSRWPYFPAGPIYLQSSVSFSGCLSICFPTVSSIWTTGAFTSWYARALIGGLLLCNNWYSVTPGETFDCLTVLSFELFNLEAKFIFALCSGNYPNMYLKEEPRLFCHCTYFYQILSAHDYLG